MASITKIVNILSAKYGFDIKEASEHVKSILQEQKNLTKEEKDSIKEAEKPAKKQAKENAKAAKEAEKEARLLHKDYDAIKDIVINRMGDDLTIYRHLGEPLTADEIHQFILSHDKQGNIDIIVKNIIDKGNVEHVLKLHPEIYWISEYIEQVAPYPL